MKTYIYEIKYHDPVDEKYETRQIHIRKRDFSKAQLAMLKQLDTMRLQHKLIMMVELIGTLEDEKETVNQNSE